MQHTIQLPTIDARYNLITYRLNFKQIVFTLGYRCNLNCPSCFLGNKLNDHKSVIIFKDALDVIESTAALQTIGTIAFVGGEPFLYYDLMLKIASYSWEHYQCALNISTNATWANSKKKAWTLLQPLIDRGLKWILVSIDDFHIKSANLESIINCLSVCLEAGLNVSVQTLQHLNAINSDTFKTKLSGYLDVEDINWISNPVTPIGNAAWKINKGDLLWHYNVPHGGCSAGEVLNVQPNGEVKPCCGAGLSSDRLTIGHIKKQSIYEMVKKAEADVILNMLIAFQGPRGIANLLEKEGYSNLIACHSPFSDACYACHVFLNDRNILNVIDNISITRKVQTLIQRIVSCQGIHLMQKCSQEHSEIG
ncbi:MAG: radical SAM/SPASM domain-containing protein [Saprospiraceae bacterium]